ncbi:hypothetical protein Tco_1572904 [Tanacetum coccineum]
MCNYTHTNDSPENDLALNVDHVFEADECDAFDSDVDKGPTTQTMFMANLTSEDPIYDEAGPSYDSNTPFEYVEDNEDHVVQSNVSSIRNDALMSILDEMHEQGVQSGLENKPDMIVNDLVTSELARYKELVGEYEKRAKFELTDREQKIDEQMRIMISDRNIKETSLKSELHSAQILLSSTVGHYKNGHVLVMSNHTRPVVHDSEDTHDMAEITRKRMMEKMQSPQCVENKVRIAPPDYSKENLLATFAPQRNLTPEHIFWSIDDNDRKKAETSVPKPISALTVYPPNTPVKLVPRILPTKSQVKINLYVLT